MNDFAFIRFSLGANYTKKTVDEGETKPFDIYDL